MQLNDTTRTMLMAFIMAVVNLAVLFGWDISLIQLSGINVVVSTGTLLFFYVFKKGQAPDPNLPAPPTPPAPGV